MYLNLKKQVDYYLKNHNKKKWTSYEKRSIFINSIILICAIYTSFLGIRTSSIAIRQSAATSQVNKSQHSMQVFQLTDRASFNRYNGGDAIALNILKGMDNEKAVDKKIAKLINDKLYIIDKSYGIAELIIANTPLCIVGKDKECDLKENQVDENNPHVKSVIVNADNTTYWSTRARSISIMSKIKRTTDDNWEIILDKITKAIEDDISLAVRREALVSFDALTDFDRESNFDFDKALAWWETDNNAKGAIKKLKEERR